MAHRFHTLRVRDVRRETPDCVSIAFDIPDALRETFAFQPGQNLVVRTRLQGQDIRRNYSICTPPHSGELRIAVKQIPEGRFSTWANHSLKAGDTLEVMPPDGRFCPTLPGKGPRTYAAFAAGSGITPIASIVAHALATNPESRCLLVYGNRDRRHIIFRENLEALKNRYLQRLQIIHVLSRETMEADINSGRIDEHTCRRIDTAILPLATVDDFFLCGPAGMLNTVSHTLLDLGVDPKRIHQEHFHTPTGTDTSPRSPRPDTATETARVALRLDGITTTFDAPTQGPTLLDAAIRHGIDLPYACKGGMCGTCRARLLQGTVHMDQQYALETSDIQQGYILTCQSHPTSPSLSIDLDAR
jgi:ring-1,2-phenylacetyl-CoA epoxidase subunit PaaE